MTAAPDRTAALIFGADDYAADVGAVRTPSNAEVWFARNQVLLHAKSAGLQAIDLVQINFNDKELLTKESVQGFELGYTGMCVDSLCFVFWRCALTCYLDITHAGKQIIHPNQIEPVQSAFSPNPKALTWSLHQLSSALLCPLFSPF